MTNSKTVTVSKMSPMVVECELRSVLAEIECQLRHGLQPTKPQADYAAALFARQAAA